MKKQYFICVKHVDNRLVIFFNGENIWDSGIVHDDPEMDVRLDITRQFEHSISDVCELIFEGFNDAFSPYDSVKANPWHFEYQVVATTVDANGNTLTETDLVQPYHERHLSNPNIRAINNKYSFVRKGEDFVVVSNSLTQNFVV
ncbi:MAG: hypothetical protein EAY75_13650 [Bacteroidetes bacterium]|nr:MAG: hypothetical protein EAY75_13650 [Bacteroidota bacterium]